MTKPIAFIRQIGDSHVVSTSDNPKGFIFKASPMKDRSGAPISTLESAVAYLRALRRHGYQVA